MSENIDKLLKDYDSDIVRTMEFLIYDMTEYLEKKIERDELEERVRYTIDRIQRVRR